MAKRTLESAIDELMKNYESALKEAVEYASNEAVKDIYKESVSCLERYYDSYDPTSYERTDSLWRSIVPYLDIQQNKETITSSVGVEYDAARIDGLYYGSKKYSPTDSSWILDNYLRGVHPATDGSSKPGEAFYYENVDPISPTQHMTTYLNNYASTTFHKNIIVSFAKQIKRMN